ncbi:MAG: hypothetical protein HYY61_06875 [Deltaproteobacteria bacterium]|nr:hypothetical protein [Deltaproteobacteria bacterium]
MLSSRIKTQLKPVPFPQDYIKLIDETFEENYKKYLEPDEQIIAEGAVYPQEMLIRLTLIRSAKTISCTASIDLNTKKNTLDNHVHILIDSLGAFFDEYFFENRDVIIGEEWKPYDLSTETVYMKTSTANEALEEKTNKLLKNT